MSRHIVIVGGGISGLAALEHVTRVAPDVQVTLLEAAPRVGGHIRTERDDDFLMEAGPDVLLTSKPDGIDLAKRAGLGDRIQGTNPAVKGSYILSRGKLLRMPDGLTGLVPSRIGPFVRTPLLSLPGKARVALEYFIPARRDDRDESIEQFVVRRLGREMYDRLVEPLLCGISAGDGTKLSMAAMFPQLRAYEREHGGLIRGMLAAKRRARQGPSTARRAGIGPFATFPGGLEELVTSVVRTVSARDPSATRVRIRTGAAVTRVSRYAGGLEADGESPRFAIAMADGETIAAAGVIIAAPAYVASTLLHSVDAELSKRLDAITYASTVTVSLAYPADAVRRPLDATGYVVPRTERRAVLACTWSSAKFVGRAPSDRVLLRLFFGGAFDGGTPATDDADVLQAAAEEVRGVMGISAPPLMARINRFDRAMPQYTVGHAERMRAIGDGVAGIPGLELAGAVYRGVGIPDCIRSGVDAASRALDAIGSATSITSAHS